MNQNLEKHNLPQLKVKSINLNNPRTVKEIELVTFKLPKKTHPGPHGSIGEFY